MSDSPDSPNVPAPEPNDSAEVVRCLEAAREMWELAQLKEAVRWVQRGADAAEQDGNDMRALALARLGADLSAHARSVAEKSDDKPAENAQEKPAEAPTSAPSTPPARSLPSAPSPPRPRVSQPPPLPGAVPVEAEKVAAVEEKPERPSVPVVEKPAAEKPIEKAVVEKASAAEKPTEKSSPSGSEKAGPSNAPARTLPTAPSRPPAAERASVRPVPHAPTISKSPSPSMSPKPAAAAAATNGAHAGPPAVSVKGNVPIAELLASGKAERVTVKRSALDGSVLVVRPSQGGKLPHGARQAVLVYTEDDAG
jgi:hypothetical protein